MRQLVQTLTDGIAVGAVYALIALGYTLVYGILQFINFAHSDVFALGAWLSFAIAAALGLSIESSTPPAWYTGALVLLLAMAGCGLTGFLIERFAYRPLRHAPRLNVLITAIGVSLLLQNLGQLDIPVRRNVVAWIAAILLVGALGLLTRSLVKGERWSARIGPFIVAAASACQLLVLPWGYYVHRVMFGPYPKAMPALLPDHVLFQIAGVQLRLVDAVVLGTALFLMVVIQYLVFHTKIGTAMRAVSFNHQTAALMGINVGAVISMTFVLGSVFAAAAGFLYAMKYAQLKQTADNVWVLLGLKAFVAAVVGGIGNIRGAMLGGIFIGLIEFLGVAYVSDRYRDVYVFAILIVVLLIRPSGILGKATVEKV